MALPVKCSARACLADELGHVKRKFLRACRDWMLENEEAQPARAYVSQVVTAITKIRRECQSQGPLLHCPSLGFELCEIYLASHGSYRRGGRQTCTLSYVMCMA